MFIFGMIGIILLLSAIGGVTFLNSSIYHEWIKNRKKQVVDLTPNSEKSNLSDLQETVVVYLQRNGASSISDIIQDTKVSRRVINNLFNKGVIMKKQLLHSKTQRLIGLIIGSILVILSAFVANYYLMVTVNLRFYGIFFYVFVIIGIILNLVLFYYNTEEKKSHIINGVYVLGCAVLLFGLFLFGGRPIFFADEYTELIEIEEADFIEDISTVDVNTLPLVDKAYGNKLGSLKLGEYPGIGSEFETGEYSDIIYQGEQYLVAPLEYRGFFKWLNNRNQGTPGYILINKVTGETRFINLKETTGEGLFYTPSAYFNYDLERYAYYHGLSQYHLENRFFEIDESGTPYYVLQYSLPSIFINGGSKIAKIAVVNALDGNIGIYTPGEEPDWVDSIYPSNLLFEQLRYWGSLQDGWFNSVFAQRGVLQPSSGTRIIMNDGELFYFTGLTGAGNDESTIGFVYMGMKTKETKLYRFPGATEAAAMNKVMTLLPQNDISTSFPIPINIQDKPTYFILIKGDDGRILKYVYISAQDLELYSMSDTKIGAYNGYLAKLSKEDTQSIVDVEGDIIDIFSYVVEGNTIYWIELDNGKRYKIDVNNFTDVELRYFIGLKIGDTISIKVLDYNVITIMTD